SDGLARHRHPAGLRRSRWQRDATRDSIAVPALHQRSTGVSCTFHAAHLIADPARGGLALTLLGSTRSATWWEWCMGAARSTLWATVALGSLDRTLTVVRQRVYHGSCDNSHHCRAGWVCAGRGRYHSLAGWWLRSPRAGRQDMTPTLHIQLLGHFRLTADQTPVTALDSPRLQAVLAYLVLHRTILERRAHLAFQIWPDTTEAQAQANLRTLLHRVSHALPDADQFLHIDAQTVQWRPGAPYTLDVADVERALAQAEVADRAGDRAALCAAYMEAAELYHGDLLPALYDDWVLVERERLRQAFLAALERLVVLLEQQQDYGAAISYAQRLLRHDPLHEAAYQHLMRLHAASGDRASAVRVYHTCA